MKKLNRILMVSLSLGLTLLTQLIKLIAHITAGIVLNGLIDSFSKTPIFF